MERFIRTVIIAVLLVAGGAAVFSEFTAYRTEQTARMRLYDSLFHAQQKRRSAGRAVIESAQRANQETSRSQIASLEERLTKATPNVAAVIDAWKPRVVSILCDWITAQTNKIYLTKRGSGVLTKDAGGVYMLTNKHVITEGTAGASRCLIQRAGESFQLLLEGQSLFVSNQNLDLGNIRIANPTLALQEIVAAPLNICASRAAVGTEIVILGFPQIGGENDITATEGIISGYDGNYYITSAKVERGNSGGAAVALKDNCYLGIPTFVQVGDIESLARILDARVFLK